MKHALQALVEAERARQHHRVNRAEEEHKRLTSEPIAPLDGDDESGARERLTRARLIDQAELELERARAAAEAVQHLWVRLEEELASDRDDPRAMLVGEGRR